MSEPTPDVAPGTPELGNLEPFTADGYKGKTVDLRLQPDLTHSSFQTVVNDKRVIVSRTPTPVPASAADDIIKQAADQFGIEIVKVS
jgi:hypothetical protein